MEDSSLTIFHKDYVTLQEILKRKEKGRNKNKAREKTGEKGRRFSVFPSTPCSILCNFLLKSLSLSLDVLFLALRTTLEQHSREKVQIIKQENIDKCAGAQHQLRMTSKLESHALNLEPSI